MIILKYKFTILNTVARAILLSVAIFCGPFHLLAQRDTTKKQSIDITSSYKPVIRNAVKINFSGSQLAADTFRPVRPYNVPSQNLFYAYEPITLKPLALSQDTNLYLGTRNFVKAGFGNLNTPYIRAGLSFGDGKKSLVNLYGDYIGSKGSIKNQEYSQLTVKATGSYFLEKNEVYGSAAFSRNNYFLYGYDHRFYDFKKEDVRQQFQEINLSAGFRNTVATRYRISYNPNVQVNFFTNKDKLNESTVIINIPVEKKFGETLTVKAEAKADITNYSTSLVGIGTHEFTNNVVQLAPAVVYSSPRFTVNAGITPVWNNGKFQYLPNIFGEVQVQEKVFMIQAGWIGRIIKNTYRNLSTINPYLLPITAVNNTKETEYYGGIKASIGKHFNFSAKAGWISYNDLPFFINDPLDITGRDFKISNEAKLNNLRIHGDISYINQDKFTIAAGVTFNGYTGMQTNDKAWHTLPVEFTSSLRWWAFERVMLKADFYFFNGGNYLTSGNRSMALAGGTDLSAGAEFKINRQFSAFLDVNNIFNDKYERWHNYQVYGLNLLGGIIIKF